MHGTLRQRSIWLAIASVLAFIAIAFAYGSYALGVLTEECARELIQREVSPDNRKAARVVLVNCGPTTNYAVTVTVGPAKHSVINLEKKIFTAESHIGAAAYASAGDKLAGVEWTANDELTVRFDSRANVSRKDGHARGVSIAFVPVGSPR